MSTDYEEIVKLYDEYKYRCGRTDLDGFIGYAKMKQEKDKRKLYHCIYAVIAKTEH